MKLKLIKLAISITVILVVAKVFVSVMAYQLAAQIQSKHLQTAAIDFSSFSTGLFSGTVQYEQVRFRPFQLKREAQFDELHLSYGGFIGLVSGMVGALTGDYYRFEEVQIRNARMSLPDQAFYDWLRSETGIASGVWLGWMTCSGNGVLSQALLNKMGVSELKFDAKFAPGSGGNWQATFEPQQLGRIEFVGRIKIKTSSDHLFSWLDLKHVKYVENGVFRRLFNACEPPQEMDLTTFSELVVEAWANYLAQQSYRLDASSLSLIKRFIQSGGALTFDISPIGIDAVERVQYGWLPLELQTEFLIALNDDKAQKLKIEQFNPEPEPEPVPVIVEPHQPEFVVTPVEDMDVLLTRTVRVSMEGEKVYQGKLVSVDEFRFEIEPVDAAGKVSYSLERKNVVDFEVWK